MLAQAAGLILAGGFIMSVRPGILGHDNIIHLKDNESYKYRNIQGFNYGIFSGVEYWRDSAPSSIPCHIKYKFSLRPLQVYHNGELIYHDCFSNRNK
jgi:hypothetical protein